jgi:hypothetical protein
MLDLSAQGLSVNSVAPLPPHGSRGGGTGNQRQLMCISLNDQILEQILHTGGEGLKIAFAGGDKPVGPLRGQVAESLGRPQNRR